MTLSAMNPPKGGKKKRQLSAKQRAWQKKFAAMYGGGKKKGGKKKKRSSASAEGSTTVAKKKKGGKRRSSGKRYSSRPSGGGRSFSVGSIVSQVKQAAPAIAIGGAGFLGASKLPDFVPDKYLAKADGTPDPNKRLAAKAGATLLMFLGARMLGMRSASTALLVGGGINVAYSLAARFGPPAMLPKSLSGMGDAGDGFIEPREFAALAGGGMGANIMVRRGLGANVAVSMPN